MTDQIKQLESAVQALKIRAFDAQESAAQYQAQAETFRGFLGQIAQEIGLTGEQIEVQDVLDAVKSLVAIRDEQATPEVDTE